MRKQIIPNFHNQWLHTLWLVLLLLTSCTMSETAPPTLQPSPNAPLIDVTAFNELLFKSINQGDLNGVIQALEGGASIEALNGIENTPLIEAIKQKEIDITYYLLEKGANINYKNKKGTMALHYALGNMNINYQNRLIRNQNVGQNAQNVVFFSLNSQEEDRDSLDILEILCDANVDVNAPDANGNTGLHHAMFSNAANISKIIPMLLREGAKTLSNSSGQMPLTLCNDMKRADIDDITKLLETKEEIRKPTIPSLTSLAKSSLLTYLLLPSNEDQKRKILYELLSAKLIEKNNIHIDTNLGYGNKLIHLATKACNLSLLNNLVLYDCQQINYINLAGQTPLHIAAQKGYQQVASYLVQCNSINIDIPSKGGYSPLHYAIMHKHNEVIYCLAQSNKANLNVTDYFGKTPLHYAVSNGSLELAKCLIEKGANVNQQDKSGLSPLFLAIEQKLVPIVLYLIEKGANVNEDGGEGITPLAELVLRPFDDDEETEQVLRWLIKYGADINQVDKFGDTPLHHAAFQGNTHLVELLISLGADHKIKNHRDKLASDLGGPEIGWKDN